MDRLRTGIELSAIRAKQTKRSFIHKFRQHGHTALADAIERCGQPDFSNNILDPPPYKCGSVYCAKCHSRFVGKQEEAVRSLFNRYATEAEQQKNIVHLTIEFDAFRLFTKKSSLFVPQNFPQEAKFPTEYALSALADARHALKHKLRHQFPEIGYAGAFEWELFSDETLNWRKRGKNAVRSLLGSDKIRDPKLSDAQAHIVLFHAHIVVDLNGAPKTDFREWMRNEFTNRCGLPTKDSVYIQSLRSDRGIDESIKCLARYPLKTYLHYKRPGLDDPFLPIDSEAVAALAAFRSERKWQGIKISCKPKAQQIRSTTR